MFLLAHKCPIIHQKSSLTVKYNHKNCALWSDLLRLMILLDNFVEFCLLSISCSLGTSTNSILATLQMKLLIYLLQMKLKVNNRQEFLPKIFLSLRKRIVSAEFHRELYSALITRPKMIDDSCN